MAVNSIGDFIRSVFPSGVNRNGNVFKALLADKETNNGTIEKVFYEIETERKKWCDSVDAWKQTGDQLHKTMDCISILDQSNFETDENFRRRNMHIFSRYGKVHGTVYDIKKLFESYLNNECHVVNNSMEYEQSILLNGKFETDEYWELVNCHGDKSAAFEGNLGILFNSTDVGSATQSVTVNPDKVYCFHAFCKGLVSIIIEDDIGRVYDYDSWQWVDNPVEKITDNKSWRNESIIIKTDERVSALTIKFVNNGSKEGAVDYVRLFEKDSTSCFSLIVSFSGAYTLSTLHIAPNEDGTYDPPKQSYIDQSFIYGGSGGSQILMILELLDAVKPFGIHASLEVLTAN